MGTWTLIAWLNRADREVDVSLPRMRLGVGPVEEQHIVDFWNAAYRHGHRDRLDLGKIPLHNAECVAAPRRGTDAAWLGDTLRAPQGLAVARWSAEPF